MFSRKHLLETPDLIQQRLRIPISELLVNYHSRSLMCYSYTDTIYGHLEITPDRWCVIHILIPYMVIWKSLTTPLSNKKIISGKLLWQTKKIRSENSEANFPKDNYVVIAKRAKHLIWWFSEISETKYNDECLNLLIITL